MHLLGKHRKYLQRKLSLTIDNSYHRHFTRFRLIYLNCRIKAINFAHKLKIPIDIYSSFRIDIDLQTLKISVPFD